MRCYRMVPGGIVLAVRLTPKSARDALEGVGALSDGRAVAHVRVRAVPEKGAANVALILLMARLFSVPKSSVDLIGGATARLKQVRIRGAAEALAAIAESWPQKQAGGQGG